MAYTISFIPGGSLGMSGYFLEAITIVSESALRKVKSLFIRYYENKHIKHSDYPPAVGLHDEGHLNRLEMILPNF